MPDDLLISSARHVSPRQDSGCNGASGIARVSRCTLLSGGIIAVLLGGWSVPTLAACNKPITVAETQQMNYGTIYVTSGGGTVKMAANGTVTAPGGFVLSGLPAAGTFNVNGTNGCTVTISFTPGSLTGPGTAMTITNFTTNAGPTPVLAPAGGQLTFSVGADLLINAAQAGGNCSGTYTVTVIY